ncbi:hypothetical protein [Acidisoma sp.]|uniref:hypothetical protein n=1 Tax=Acidisoma sp. TaxID=1872115 RepID=UPI003B00DD1B
MMTDIDVETGADRQEFAGFSDALEGGMAAVADLERSLEALDALVLTGPPHAIADAAKAMEMSLFMAEPTFRRITLALEAAGAVRLQDAAHRLRRADQAVVAAAVDTFRSALRRFAQRNEASHRRAQGLVRGLSASLRTLHALGVAGNGRLIAAA